MFDLRFAMYDEACTARQLSASKGQPCKRTSKIENQTSKISCDKVRFRGATKLGLRIIVCVKTKPDGYAPKPLPGPSIAHNPGTFCPTLDG